MRISKSLWYIAICLLVVLTSCDDDKKIERRIEEQKKEAKQAEERKKREEEEEKKFKEERDVMHRLEGLYSGLATDSDGSHEETIEVSFVRNGDWYLRLSNKRGYEPKLTTKNEDEYIFFEGNSNETLTCRFTLSTRTLKIDEKHDGRKWIFEGKKQ